MYAYNEAGFLQRIVRRTAGTRLLAWFYGHIQQRTDQTVFRLTDGRTTLSSWMSGLPVLMLTTIGAKTGEKRTLPVLGILDGDDVVLIASNYGRPHNPAWYYNLLANPRATIALKGVIREVIAGELPTEEAERYFQKAVDMYPSFLQYRRWAGNRRIPVIKLHAIS
jgi:deazaflavin-dependent oxidoreductase (nitroreductase family)